MLQVDDEAVSRIGTNCPELVTLNIYGCKVSCMHLLLSMPSAVGVCMPGVDVIADIRTYVGVSAEHAQCIMLSTEHAQCRRSLHARC